MRRLGWRGSPTIPCQWCIAWAAGAPLRTTVYSLALIFHAFYLQPRTSHKCHNTFAATKPQPPNSSHDIHVDFSCFIPTSSALLRPLPKGGQKETNLNHRSYFSGAAHYWNRTSHLIIPLVELPVVELLVMRSTDELNGLGGISFVVFILLCGTVLDSVCWPCGGEPTFGARECSLSVQHCTNNQPSSCVLPLWSITWTGMKTGMCMAVGCWLLAAGK